MRPFVQPTKPKLPSVLLPLAAATLFSVSSADAALVNAGNGLINDTDFNLTWTQDANLFRTQATANANLVNQIISLTPNITDTFYGAHQVVASDFDTRLGTMSWWGASAWVNYLNNGSGYQGYTDWRLPTSSAVVGFDSSNELGHLFYAELGGTAGRSIVATHTNAANYNLFSNIQESLYWSGTERASDATYAWLFKTVEGIQDFGKKGDLFHAWAVRTGQVTAVPVPGAVWLMGSALMGLVSGGRRKTGALATK